MSAEPCILYDQDRYLHTAITIFYSIRLLVISCFDCHSFAQRSRVPSQTVRRQSQMYFWLQSCKCAHPAKLQSRRVPSQAVPLDMVCRRSRCWDQCLSMANHSSNFRSSTSPCQHPTGLQTQGMAFRMYVPVDALLPSASFCVPDRLPEFLAEKSFLR